MAKGQVKKTSASAGTSVKVSEDQMVFALDIGTRSIIGMVGVIEEGKVRIIAIEKEEHAERAMVDGQIENIEKVAILADRVKKRLQSKLGVTLTRVCVAAAGRALRTRRSDFEMELSGAQIIDDEVISRLEAGAISRAEEAFDEENEAQGDLRRYYLVGYTVCQYYLDQYMMSSLKDHRGRQVKVDLIATFLPSEVVESLYTTMNKIGLEVASLTLEPIAAINAAIPENLRLLNLVMVDIGAGTSDIAACTGGSVTGYTMATVAGDEITEALMKAYLVDFETAEMIKVKIDQEKEIVFSDILGFEHKVSQDEIFQSIQGTSELLCKEIAEKILEVNAGPPSALFLAGGGSKLAHLRDGLAAALGMDMNRVAVAGNYFQISAFSEEYDLNNPEYATPLGIAISSGLNMINDSFRVILNGKPAKLFRSGSFTALNLLMMNGYSFRDIMGRSGQSIAVTVNGERKMFYGTAAQPASLGINGREGKLSEIIHAGDSIDFVPAVPGEPAQACLGDIEGALACEEITLNGMYAFLETPLKSGDVVEMKFPGRQNGKEGGRTKDTAEDGRKEGSGNEEDKSGDKRQQGSRQAPPVMMRETPVLETAAAGRGKIEKAKAEPLKTSREMAPQEEHGLTETTEWEKTEEEEQKSASLIMENPEQTETPETGRAIEREADGQEVKGNARAEELSKAAANPEPMRMVRREVKQSMPPETFLEASANPEPLKTAGREVKRDVRVEEFSEAVANPEPERTEEWEVKRNVHAEVFPEAAENLEPLKTARREVKQSMPSETFSQASANPEPLKMAEREERRDARAEAFSEASANPEPLRMAEREEKRNVYAEAFPEAANPEPVKMPEPETKRSSDARVISEPARLPEPKESPEPVQERKPEPVTRPVSRILFYLNGNPLRLPRKKDGQPYYLMDMIEYSGIDLKNPGGTVKLTVNGEMGMFQQELRERDAIEIRVQER